MLEHLGEEDAARRIARAVADFEGDVAVLRHQRSHSRDSRKVVMPITPTKKIWMDGHVRRLG